MAGFDYAAAAVNITDMLLAHNTTTASPYLSQSMTSKVVTIARNDPGIFGLRGDIYPAVFVRVNKKSEEFAGMGATGPAGARKHAVVDFDVIGFYRKDGAYGSQQQVLVELENMARNIEAVFQQEYTLSGTALWCQAKETSFYGPFQNDEVWIKAVVCNLEAEYHFR